MAAAASEIAMLPSAAADDGAVTAALTGVINEVYAVAEDGLWADGASRTTVEGITGLVRAGQIAVARVGGEIIGCVRVQILGGGVGEFGMLAVVPSHRSTGVGRELVRFAERAVRAQHCDTMQLELLVPRDWAHPSKEFLAAWYRRIGYAPVRVGAIDESYPDLAPLLATPCDLVIYRRSFEPDQ